jgi:hypothetical protein
MFESEVISSKEIFFLGLLLGQNLEPIKNLLLIAVILSVRRHRRPSDSATKPWWDLDLAGLRAGWLKKQLKDYFRSKKKDGGRKRGCRFFKDNRLTKK